MATALDHVVDVARHGGEEIPTEGIPKPQLGRALKLDASVVRGKTSSEIAIVIAAYIHIDLALSSFGAEIVSALNYGMSLWGTTAKIVTRMPDKTTKNYFLKVVIFCPITCSLILGYFL